MFTSLQITFLICIAIVVVITAGYAILFSRQMKKLGKNALAAKQRKRRKPNQLDD